MAPALYRAADRRRFLSLPGPRRVAAGRGEFRRDYARIVHSPSFRRLQGKTQLFAGSESDFFRNRLTHSLEVAQIAKTLALVLNASEPMRDLGWAIDTDLVECAALAHDLGHPPFGHTGEAVLDRLMHPHGGFEGNAQTLRLLARLEKKLDDQAQLDEAGRPRWYGPHGDCSYGLNLTKRTLASVLKYDRRIPWSRPSDPTAEPAPVKGYYGSEHRLVVAMKRAVVGVAGPGLEFRTVECQLMDLADDIAYSTYDVEDAFRARLLTPLDLVDARPDVFAKVAKRCNAELEGTFEPSEVRQIVSRMLLPYLSGGDSSSDETRYQQSRMLAEAGFFRNAFTSALVDAAVRAVRIEPDLENPSLSKVVMEPEARARVAVLKHLVYVLLIESPTMRLVARRATHIVETTFGDTLTSNGELLPEDWAERHEQAPEAHRPRVVCDFIAGMTDRQAIDFYARLRSADHRTMFGLA